MTSWLVIGGGISGLTAALAVLEREPTARVTVLEGSDRPGGKLSGARVAGCEVDVGAEAVLARRPEAVELAHQVGLGDELVHPTSAGAQVWSRGRIHPLPRRTLMGVPADPGALTGLLTGDEVRRAAAEPAGRVEADDVSVGELVSGRMGGAVTQRLVEPLLGGVYAGHADLISARAALPALLRAAQEGQRLFRRQPIECAASWGGIAMQPGNGDELRNRGFGDQEECEDREEVARWETSATQ